MRFSFSEDQLLLQKTVRDFLEGECAVDSVRALWETEIGGVETNIPLHRKIMADERFAAQAVDVSYL